MFSIINAVDYLFPLERIKGIEGIPSFRVSKKEIGMDPNLHKAASSGDVEFLRRAIGSRPHDDNYFLAHEPEWGSNIFHLAAYYSKVEFMKEAIVILPTHIVQQLLTSQQHHLGWNPLHDAVKEGYVEIVRIMLGFYTSYSGPPLVPNDINHPRNKPWLALSRSTTHIDTIKWTPLRFAIEYNQEECAMEILSMDMELFCKMLDEDGNSLLFLLIQKGYNRVAEMILNSSCSYSLAGKDGSTALHIAPRCSGNITKLLLQKHLDCLDTIDRNGLNVLCQWAKDGIESIGQLELLLDEQDFSDAARSKVFWDLIRMKDVGENEISPLHTAMTLPNLKFAEALIYFYEQQLQQAPATASVTLDFPRHPCRVQSKNGDTPLHVSISSKLEEHALYFLSLDRTLCEILNNKGESPLLVAVSNGCEQVVQKILTFQHHPYNTMLRRNDGRTLLHFLKNCSVETGKLLLEKYWWMINMRDDNGRTALDEAKEGADPLLVNLLMHPSLIKKEPFDWTIACERDEAWAVMAFIDTCEDLPEICREEIDTPLHHIRFDTCREYLNFLKNQSINELKNATDEKGATPLHRALERKDINLARALLIDTKVERNIAHHTGKTAMDLLDELCKENDDWANMCKEILKTKYIHPGTNLDQMRNSLSVVAALLTTISFAAAFTLPGGLDGNSGSAVLAKKPAFIVFLLANVLTMCTSILVLFCLICSLISDRDMSYFLVDRSVLILRLSLCSTMLAFMTGIFVVISPDSKWVAIIVLVWCSLVAISMNRTVLHKIHFKLVPAKASSDNIHRNSPVPGFSGGPTWVQGGYMNPQGEEKKFN